VARIVTKAARIVFRVARKLLNNVYSIFNEIVADVYLLSYDYNSKPSSRCLLCSYHCAQNLEVLCLPLRHAQK
jgi:hypothetical protein